MTQTFDGGYAAVGFVDNGFGDDGVIVKTDSSGNVLWAKTCSGMEVLFFSVKETRDSGLIVTGEVYGKLLLLKIDATGNFIWQKSYDNSQYSQGYSLRELFDEGFIVTGVSDIYPVEDIFLLRADKLGNIIWAKTIGGNSSDIGNDVQQCPDNGFIVSGSTNSFGWGTYDALLIKLDSNGVIQWAKTYGNIDSDNFVSVAVSNDSGFVCAGRSSAMTSPQTIILKTDSNGNLLWNKFYSVGGANDMEKTSDGGFIITSSSGNSGYLLKTDDNGDLLWGNDLPGETSHSVEPTVDAGFVIASGFINGFQITKTDHYGFSGCNQSDFFSLVSDTAYITNPILLVIDGATSSNMNLGIGALSGDSTICSSLSSYNLEIAFEITIYPNPARNQLTVNSNLFAIKTIEIFNLLGNLESSFGQMQTAQHREIKLDISDLNTGIYYVKICTENNSLVKKLIIR